jgi:hypothetical protein
LRRSTTGTKIGSVKWTRLRFLTRDQEVVMRALVLLSLLLVPAAIAAQPAAPAVKQPAGPPAKQPETWEESIIRKHHEARASAAAEADALKALLPDIDRRAAAIKKGRVNAQLKKTIPPREPGGAWMFPAERFRQQALAELDGERGEIEAKIKKLLAPAPLELPHIEPPFKVGAVGPLLDPRVNVVQVFGRQRMLVRTSFIDPSIVYPGGRLHSTEAMFMVRGLDTSEVADGQGYELPETVRVTGTYRYITAQGSPHTVFVLEPADGKAVLRDLEKKIAAADDKPPAAAAAK